MTRRPELSVAICTRNRADSLGSMLESLRRCARTVAPRYEVLVVDNGSTDQTAAVIERFADIPALRRIHEPEEGLSRARNRAIDEFKGPWLVFTDDDVRVSVDWLDAILSAIDTRAEMDYFGGRSLPVWERPRPAWLMDPDAPFIQGLLCNFDLGETDRVLAPSDPVPFGVNMGFHRRVLEALEGFRTDMGPGAGTRGEETEYLGRVRKHGFQGWYLGRALVHHRTDHQRFRLTYLYRHGVRKGRGHGIVGELGPGSLREEVSQLGRGAWQGLIGHGDRMRVCVVNAGIQRGLRQVRGARPRRPG